MNFIVPPPSLEHKALVEIAITLWSQGDVRNLMNKNTLQEGRWKGVEEIVVKKASELLLPTLLKEKLLDVIGPVGFEILSFANLHKRVYGYTSPLTLFWTPHGTIDSKRTVEEWVKDETLDIWIRLKFACYYCLEDYILDLRKKCYNSKSRHIPPKDIYALSFWCKYLEQTDDRRRAVTIVINFIGFAKFGNEEAVRYFGPKLSTEITGELRVNIAKSVAHSVHAHPMRGVYFKKYSDILCFLLSTMNVEQQSEIFESHCYQVLKSLLVWPRHCLFLETAKGKWSFLRKEIYYTLLIDIIDGMSFQRNYFGELFKEFWLQAPESHKQFVTNEDYIAVLLSALRKKEDGKNIQLILKDLSISAREKLFFTDVGRDICKYLASSEKWDSVEYLIQECIPSR